MDEVRCPYCNKEVRVETCDLNGEEEFIEVCPHCEEEFQVYAEIVLELYASKVEYFNCEICGKKEYEIDKMTLPYEKENGEWEYKKLCDECCWKELKRRREQE